MKLLYLHQYFKTSNGGTRSYEVSKYLVNKGIDVTVICGNQEEGKIDEITIKNTNTKYAQEMSFVQRIYSFIHYMQRALFIGMKEKDVDVIYATSTPLTIGIPAIILSKLKRKKLIFEVRDLWPDVPIELGILKNKFLIKLSYWLELSIYKHAHVIIALSSGMKKEIVKKGVPAEKIKVIENMSYIDSVKKSEAINTNELANESLEGKLICLHHGTMGFVNDLDYILDLARDYPHEDIVYLLIGEGREKEALMNRVAEESIRNVYIINGMKEAQVFGVLKASHVGMMVVRDEEVLENNSANKLFDFFAAGLPVVINYSGWQKKVIEENGAGKSFHYDDKESTYLFLKTLLHGEEKRNAMSKASKQLASKKYDSNKLCGKILEVVLETYNSDQENVIIPNRSSKRA